MSNEDRIHLDVYGIRNCDSCRSTLRFLESRNVPHTFHDFRTEGLGEELLASWLASSHRDHLLNRRSTTWRQLSEEEKRAAESNPMAVLLEHPTLIKRPVITEGLTILDVGFSPDSLEDYI
ncbi:Spx/MgsR family RNA polymerase-binding regulatory protein [Pseudomonadota bacterium]